MRNELRTLQILNTLRVGNDSGTKLGDLLEDRYKGEIPNHTGAGIFGAEISKLTDAGFIKLFDDQGADKTEQIREIGRPGEWNLDRGYKVADFLRGREGTIYASLTPMLGIVQSVLGVSVTRLIEDFDATAIFIQPMFGKPIGDPRADVFVLMPFHQDFLPIYDDHIQKVCERLELNCRRADNIFGSSQIMHDVWELIANSKMIIADCTGRNPNVFYELGIAHTLGKPVVIITQSADDIPFDIRHIRYIKYNYTPRGMKEFEASLKKFIAEERERKPHPLS
jgi:hypothetical protein